MWGFFAQLLCFMPCLPVFPLAHCYSAYCSISQLSPLLTFPSSANFLLPKAYHFYPSISCSHPLFHTHSFFLFCQLYFYSFTPFFLIPFHLSLFLPFHLHVYHPSASLTLTPTVTSVRPSPCCRRIPLRWQGRKSHQHWPRAADLCQEHVTMSPNWLKCGPCHTPHNCTEWDRGRLMVRFLITYINFLACLVFVCMNIYYFMSSNFIYENTCKKSAVKVGKWGGQWGRERIGNGDKYFHWFAIS